jgi:hypothetical protein
MGSSTILISQQLSCCSFTITLTKRHVGFNQDKYGYVGRISQSVLVAVEVKNSTLRLRRNKLGPHDEPKLIFGSVPESIRVSVQETADLLAINRVGALSFWALGYEMYILIALITVQMNLTATQHARLSDLTAEVKRRITSFI